MGRPPKVEDKRTHEEGSRMKGIPENDGWYLCRYASGGYEIACVAHTALGVYWANVQVRESDFTDATFIPIPLPPDDGNEYACVWVKVKRDKQGNRTCMGPCDLLPRGTTCRFAVGDGYTPGPNCPLGSD